MSMTEALLNLENSRISNYVVTYLQSHVSMRSGWRSGKPWSRGKMDGYGKKSDGKITEPLDQALHFATKSSNV